MPKSKWVMLCPMARSGSSHTCELLADHDGVHCHHGLFNHGPFGRFPADRYIPIEKKEYYSAIFSEDHSKRLGGQEHSAEFLDEFIFTDDPRYNPSGADCIGFKLQFVHFVHMPDLRQYLIDNKDIKIIVNSRRNLLEHSCAEQWCQRKNSRAARPDEAYDYADPSPIEVDLRNVTSMFRNLLRYRKYTHETFNDGQRDFFEWSYEDMFCEDGSLDNENHQKLFDCLEIRPSKPFESTFAKTPRPDARGYFRNFEAVKEHVSAQEDGIFAKYFADDYNPRKDREWPVMRTYQLERIMQLKDNSLYRT